MANGFKTGGRQKGVPNKSTTEKQRQAREVGQLVMAFAGLAEKDIQALLPKDVLRLVTHHYVRIGDLEKAADHASKWAPYEHAKFAPALVEPSPENEDDRARRLHDAMKAMRDSVGHINSASEVGPAQS